MHTSLTRRTALLAMAACAASPGGAWAQNYPQRPVRLVVPFPAGTGTDLTARLMAQQLQTALGQPFVVDNKPGAGGSIGAMEVVRAAPDGHTLLFSSNSAAASNVALLKSMPYDPARDLTLVSGIGESALVRTAVYGRDANWGRINQAVGQALALTGGRVDFTLRFDGVLPDGQGIDEVMARPEYEIQVGLGRGDGRAELFASDLGHGYVSVNADYRT